MKLGIEEFLYQIDQSFAQKEQKEVYLVYLMLFAAIFASAYILFWEDAEKEYNAEKAKVVAVQQKITVDKTYLNQNPPSKIVEIENNIKSLQK